MLYTYNPFGEVLETDGTLDNGFMFAGQFYDSEIQQYYLRARDYNPHIYRFTARDPVDGQFEQPITLHKYLYCGNDPVNRIDLTGSSWQDFVMWLIAWLQRGRPGAIDSDTETTLKIIDEATELVGQWWKGGPFLAFAIPGYYDYKHSGSTFQLYDVMMKDSEFGNYLAGYTSYYNYVEFGDFGVRLGGELFAMGDYYTGQSDSPYDDLGSIYFISAGILNARQARAEAGLRKGAKLDFVLAKFGLFEGISRAADTDLTSTDFDIELTYFLQFWHSCTE